MKGVSFFSFDFNKMEVTLVKERKRVTQQRNVKSGTCKMIKGKRLKKLLRYKLSQVAQLFSIEAREELERQGDQQGQCMMATNNQTTPRWKVHKLTSSNTLLIKFQDLFYRT